MGGAFCRKEVAVEAALCFTWLGLGSGLGLGLGS